MGNILNGGRTSTRKKRGLVIGLIALLISLAVHFWPASHVVGNFDPRSDDYAHGERP